MCYTLSYTQMKSCGGTYSMWKDTILQALNDRHLFQSDDHRSRFKELLDCYADASFFTPGLCKCMFMSCWDEEHFFIMLDMLNQLSLKRHMGLNDMCENGELIAEEEEREGSYENQVMRLSCAFLKNEPFSLSQLPEEYDPTGRRIIEISLLAAAAIDEKANEDQHS